MGAIIRSLVHLKGIAPLQQLEAAVYKVHIHFTSGTEMTHPLIAEHTHKSMDSLIFDLFVRFGKQEKLLIE